MRMDLESITEQINAFWGDHGYAVIAAAGLLVLALLAVSLVKIARSAQRDRWVAGVTALVVLAWTSEGLWEVARHTLELPLGFAIMTFFVYEAMMVTSALQAERHRKHHPTPGPAGRYVWLLASLTASTVALNAPTLVEALLRLSLPLAATGLWWLGITAERADDSAEVRRLREELRQAREARRRRALATIRFLPPAALPPSETVHERRIRRMVVAGIRLHSAKPNSRRARRAHRRLCRLAMGASDHNIAAVRDTIYRAVHVVELILPSGLSASVDAADASSRSGHRPTDAPNIDMAVPQSGQPQPAPGAEQRTVTQQDRTINRAGPHRHLPNRAGVDRFEPFPPAIAVPATPGGQPSSAPPTASTMPSGAGSQEAVAGADRKGQPGAPTQGNDQSWLPTQAHGGERSPGPQAGPASSEHPQRRRRAGGSRLTAARLYRDSVRAGQRLSVSALAKQAGCCRTTAWRAIRWSQTSGFPTAQAAGDAGRSRAS